MDHAIVLKALTSFQMTEDILSDTRRKIAKTAWANLPQIQLNNELQEGFISQTTTGAR